LSKSWKSDAASFSILYTNFLPFPKKEEVVLHPERACAPGRTLHVTDLYSTQEEADTRMILQALHADKKLKELGKQGRIIIKTSDTNFFQSGMFLPSTTWNTFVWAITLVRRSLSADLMEVFLRHTGQIHLLLYVLLQSMINSRDDVTIDNILSHPVGPIPVSMFHEDGTTRKSCKLNVVKQFENEVSPVLSLQDFDPSLTTYI
jgi:hypothetical protein